MKTMNLALILALATTLTTPLVKAEYVWGVDAKNEVYFWNGISWQVVKGHLKHISVGADGTMWGVNANDEVWLYSGNHQWTRIPGNLKQIDVGTKQQVWGVDANNQVFRWNGSSWQHVPGSLKHVSVGADGTVWGIGPESWFIDAGTAASHPAAAEKTP